MKKEYVLEAMKKLPQDFELDQLLEKLIFIEKIEKGMSDLAEGKTVAHEKIDEIIKKW